MSRYKIVLDAIDTYFLKNQTKSMTAIENQTLTTYDKYKSIVGNEEGEFDEQLWELCSLIRDTELFSGGRRKKRKYRKNRKTHKNRK